MQSQTNYRKNPISKDQASKRFNAKELSLLKKRFEKMAKGKTLLNKAGFRDGLGLLGLSHATFLSDRLFNIIDSSGDNAVDFDEFMQYLAVALNGSDLEKAMIGFAFLDVDNRGSLSIKDFEKMIFDIAIFWNNVTGSKIIPKQSKIDQIWKVFNPKSTSLTFQEYEKQYEYLQDIFDWYRFFNQDDTIQEQQMEEENAQQLVDVQNIQSQVQVMLGKTFDSVDHLMHNGLLMFKTMPSKVGNGHGSSTSYTSTRLFTNHDHVGQIQGPLFINLPSSANRGDISPNGEKYSRLTRQHSVDLHRTMKFADRTRFIGQFEDQLTNLKTMVDNCLKQIKSYDQQHQRKSVKQDTKIVRESKVRKDVERYDSMKRRQTLKNIMQAETEVKRNISVYFGHENWNLILNMMIGMRKSIKIIPLYVSQFPEDNEEFKTKMIHDIMPLRDAKLDYRKVFHFIDYSPSIFYRIRLMYGVTNQEYQRSVGPESLLGNLVMGRLNSLTELGSSGKSGSFFYFTEDSKYMIKTISVLEAKFFRRILKNYYSHIKRYPQTLISRIFGFHQMKIFKTKQEVQKVYLIVICNLFETGLEIDCRYDIKGSLYGRRTRKDDQPVNSAVALKDLDMLDDKNYLRLDSKNRLTFEEQIKFDGMFFRENAIIDYSLLIGYHKISNSRKEQYGKDLRDPKYLRFNETVEGGILSKDKQTIYFFGIIDILTEYGTRKQWEHSIKSTFVSEDISCIPPLNYSKRFEDFIYKSVLEPPQFGQF